MTSLDFLRNVEVLKGLIDNKLAGIQDHCCEKDYRHNEKLFIDGDDATCLWIMRKGQVDLRFDLPDRPTSSSNTLSTVSEFMAFGWSSLVPPYIYSLSAYCATQTCRVIQIEKKMLLKIFEEDSKIGYVVMSNLVEIIGKRFHQLQDSAWISPDASIKITVHLATCGIAAGAREVMTALMDELALTDRLDIRIMSGGCIGKCDTEPNVTVEIEGEDPVIYQKMSPKKMRQVFKKHIMMGEVQSDFSLA
jgi:NADP-reducing hydrogenase subunit HndB